MSSRHSSLLNSLTLLSRSWQVEVSRYPASIVYMTDSTGQHLLVYAFEAFITSAHCPHSNDAALLPQPCCLEVSHTVERAQHSLLVLAVASDIPSLPVFTFSSSPSPLWLLSLLLMSAGVTADMLPIVRSQPNETCSTSSVPCQTSVDITSECIILAQPQYGRCQEVCARESILTQLHVYFVDYLLHSSQKVLCTLMHQCQCTSVWLSEACRLFFCRCRDCY